MFVHGVAIAFWVGALAPLIALARKRNGTVLPVLLRFSRIAVPVVGALILTGVGLAIVQLESFGALIGTRYGVILLVKLTLVAILLGLAALNRYRVTPALKVEPGNSRELKGTVFYEYVAVLLILAVVAGWRFTAPPRALAAAAQAAVEAPLAIHIHTETAMFQVLISPGKVGSDDFVLQLMAGDASPLPAKAATLTLSLPERGIEPIERGRDAWAGRLLAPARRAAAAARPLAHADRRTGHRFREGHAGGRFRGAVTTCWVSGCDVAGFGWTPEPLSSARVTLTANNHWRPYRFSISYSDVEAESDELEL